MRQSYHHFASPDAVSERWGAILKKEGYALPEDAEQRAPWLQKGKEAAQRGIRTAEMEASGKTGGASIDDIEKSVTHSLKELVTSQLNLESMGSAALGALKHLGKI